MAASPVGQVADQSAPQVRPGSAGPFDFWGAGGAYQPSGAVLHSMVMRLPQGDHAPEREIDAARNSPASSGSPDLLSRYPKALGSAAMAVTGNCRPSAIARASHWAKNAIN
jgi:hypothetical protein